MAKQRGKIIRIGPELEAMLARKKRKRESFDSLIRRCFGLPDRFGRYAPASVLLHCFWVIPNDGEPIAFCNEADAKGAAIRLAVRKGKKKTERVVKVLEVNT